MLCSTIGMRRFQKSFNIVPTLGMKLRRRDETSGVLSEDNFIEFCASYEY